MDDGELDFSNKEIFSSSNIGDLPDSCSMDMFFNELLMDTHACTHTHTCNLPGPDCAHTHTCFHMHTKIQSATPEDDKVSANDTSESSGKKSKKCPLGNREAVRKYREKKKARAASLEDEVVRLRALNQQLMKRLQGQAALKAENARLKCLLVDIRGRIEGEIGSFPYQKSAKSGDMYQNMATPNLPGVYLMNPCNMQCDDWVNCIHPDQGIEGKRGEGALLSGQDFSGCEFENLQCLGNQNAGLKEFPSCGLGNVASTVNSSGAKNRKESFEERMVKCGDMLCYMDLDTGVRLSFEEVSPLLLEPFVSSSIRQFRQGRARDDTLCMLVRGEHTSAGSRKRFGPTDPTKPEVSGRSRHVDGPDTIRNGKR
ncbi:hypothetical protein HYC85_009471 [Camellia sinensis]|uniref:BZIP domain-containing protein n=1 Tax=Camellia sinensis TaxID=4442 RepID=A0A7J7HGC2_CAMSI|nr:hypothetical protein HYC85_009471 [Camellia sinensis]